MKLLDLLVEIRRKDMPQIKTEKLPQAFSLLSRLSKIRKGYVRVGKLKKTQEDLDQKKVDGIIKYWKGKGQDPKEIKPVIISRDDFIIDGHHRWATINKGWGSDTKVPFVRIDLDKWEALRLYIKVAEIVN